MKRFSNVSYGTLVRNWLDSKPIGHRFTSKDISNEIGIGMNFISAPLSYIEKVGDIKKQIRSGRLFIWEKIRKCSTKDHSCKKTNQKIEVIRNGKSASNEAFESLGEESLFLSKLKRENEIMQEEFAIHRDAILNALCAIESLMKDR